MKFYRYMSMKEFQKMSAGCDIFGKNSFKARTNSEGVCFLGENTLVDDRDFSPIQCYIFLNGIVSSDILVEFEAADGVELEEAFGIYADPYGDYYDCMSITEYNLPMYNRDIMRPVRYCMGNPYGFSVRDEWYEFY